MPRMANLGKAVPPVEVLVLLLSGLRMTTVKPESNRVTQAKFSKILSPSPKMD